MIPIDGKHVKGSYDRSKKQSALHVVSAWASENRIMLGQMKVENKTNEITAIPALLDLLDLTGCIITIDAMGTQTDIAKRIVAKQADYVLSLKANHPTLYAQVKQWFETAQTQGFERIEHSHDRRVEAGHHRQEIRQVWAVPVSQMGDLYEQQHSRWIANRRDGAESSPPHRIKRLVRCSFISALSTAMRNALVAPNGAHWGIENKLHWVLDVSFGEDDSRIRNGLCPENFTLLRRMALSLLNQETSCKRSLKQKAKRAAMDNGYMLKVLSAASPH